MVSVNVVHSKDMASNQLRDYVEKINRGILLPGVYVITFGQETVNLLEIMRVRSYYEHLDRGQKLTVIGLASNHEEAVEMIGYICQTLTELYGDVDRISIQKEYGSEKFN